MAPTVPRTPPDRPLTVFRARSPTEKKKEDQKQKTAWLAAFCRAEPRSAAFRPVRDTERRLGSTRASAARDPLLLFFISSVAGRARNLSAAGWVGVAGIRGHGSGACARRVGQDANPVSGRVRRTAHTCKPRPSPHGWGHGVPAGPTHPASPQEAGIPRPSTRGGAVGWKLRPPALPEPGEMIGRRSNGLRALTPPHSRYTGRYSGPSTMYW